MPTLYAGDAVRKPKLSVIEVLLYNMAALLAGVAAGYDVRISNVSPVHPTLLSDVPALKAPLDMEYPNVLEIERRFTANTYHGTGKHSRTPLTSTTYVINSDEQNLMARHRSDSPTQQNLLKSIYYPKVQTAANTPKHQLHLQNQQLFYQQQQQQQQHQQLPLTLSSTSGLGSNFTTNTSGMLSSSLGSGMSHTQPPTPSPRRKISTSSFTEVLEYSPHEDAASLKQFDGFRAGSGLGPSPSHDFNNYKRNGPSFSNDGGFYGTSAFRGDYFGSNYFPYRPELNSAYERDCKSYPDYSYDYNHRLPNYYDYNFDFPQQQHQQIRTPPPRVPQMGVSATGHRRTPSTISNNSNSQSFAHENDERHKRNIDTYDFENLNLNSRSQSNKDYSHHYRDPSPVAVPVGLSKQELYKGSPKSINRWSRKSKSGLSDEPNFDTSFSNRIFDYEHQLGGAVYRALSPNHKQMQQQPHTKQKQKTRNVYSTPMSPINMKPTMQMPERPASLPFKHASLAVSDSVVSGSVGGGSSGSGGGTSVGGNGNFTPNKLRSSLKRYHYKSPNGGVGGGNVNGGGNLILSSATSQQGTPTNPTPDSLTSDDSSYLSAKEGSISSQHSRVRFSPETAYLDAQTGGGGEGIASGASAGVGAGGCGDNHDYSNRASISLLNRRISRRHTSDVSVGSASTSPTLPS